MAIKFVEDNYKEFNPLVVYGDTDSIFPELHVRGNSIYESIYKLSIIAKGISKNIAGIFPEGLVLDFEKLYSPMIIKKKKKNMLVLNMNQILRLKNQMFYQLQKKDGKNYARKHSKKSLKQKEIYCTKWRCTCC